MIDFGRLNELTDQDAYTLPEIEDILSQLVYFRAVAGKRDREETRQRES